VLDRVAESMKAPYTWVASPREHEPAAAAHADHLVVDDVRRHPHEREVAAPASDDLVSGGEGDQVGEALEGDRVAVGDELPDRVCERGDLHWATGHRRGVRKAHRRAQDEPYVRVGYRSTGRLKARLRLCGYRTSGRLTHRTGL